MPHVTFIHGLSNKPQADALHRIWREALARGDDGLELGALGVTSAMLYWAYVLYPAPDPNVAGYESLDPRSADAFDASGNAETPPGENDAERALLAALRKQMTDASDATIAAAKFYEQCAPDTIGAYSDRMPLPADLAAPQLERVPLPWFIKVKIMKAYLRDAYLYLFDKPFSPRPGTTYAVRSVIRERVTLVDPRRAGVPMTVFISVTAPRHEMAWLVKFRQMIESIPQIVEAYRLTGTVDYILKVLVPDVAAYDQVYKAMIEKLEFSQISSSISMEELKFTTAVPTNYLL